MEQNNTFENKINILAELWMNYREDEDLKDFVEYNDLGLPLSYFLMNEIVLPTDQAEMYINETYNLLIASLDVEDAEWTSLDELLGSQE
jgi:uncharacterized protein Smg (DUF494 family)